MDCKQSQNRQISAKAKPPAIRAKKQSDGEKSKGLVAVPYVQGLSERVTRVCLFVVFFLTWLRHST